MERVINVALGEVGYLEKASKANLYSKTENAGSKNYTKYAEQMSKYNPGIFANGYAWCDTFVDWCMTTAYGADAALKLIHGWSAYTPTSAGYYKNKGQWHKTPQKGDQIFFTDSSGGICHTGIVYAVDSEHVYTVEGNTSSKSGVIANGGAVEKKCYALTYSRIAGYGRPDYSIVQAKNTSTQASTQPTAAVNNKIYNKIEDCPTWAQPYVKKAMSRGILKGIGEGSLNLDDNKIWCLVIILRATGIMA